MIDFSDRHEYVGASECSVILGLNPYKSPYDLWLEKWSQEIDPPNLAMRMGSFLEPFVLDEYEKMTATKVVDRQREYVTPTGRVRAHIDGRVQGKQKLVEAKTVGEWAKKSWSEAIPDIYRVQIEVQAYLAQVKDVDLVYLVGNTLFEIVEFRADWKVGEDIVNQCSEWFTVHVKGDEAPEVTPAEGRRIWKASDTSIEATKEIEQLVYDLQNLRRTTRNLQNKVTSKRHSVMEFMTTNRYLHNREGFRMATWSQVIQQPMLNRAKLKVALRHRLGEEESESIIEECSKQNAPSRRFTLT